MTSRQRPYQFPPGKSGKYPASLFAIWDLEEHTSLESLVNISVLYLWKSCEDNRNWAGTVEWSHIETTS